ncbi:bifunctional MaoC family dehydratase N-terminal/OB-fold nucleic acid binding domain-containing protein [Nitriliruptor alkaliphilus]|uniref:bifunctional MaoC family dehydratase N-terminal/OB-fold nucleic acid binding domain-containing protein n=1 Tax=Nitriliruptor alkaliphilus TaxID=427918 RepID=UPI0006977C60|nr:MaoC family dehydratase N-terminal domain-containing protein [Nitriliruptor alkaliphilus]
MTTDGIVEAVRSIVAEGAGEVHHAPDPVNVPMIRHWVRALGDDNPAYLDEEVAAATPHGGTIAPPAMLGVWTMDCPRSDGGPRDRAMRVLDEAGFTSVVATDYEHDYLRQLRPGDRVRERRSIESISARKTTALGDGYFVTVRYDYDDEDGQPVGVGRMRLLKFRPARTGGSPAAPEPAAMPRPRPAINRDTAHVWEGYAAGEIRLQRCADCGQLRHPPGPMCPACRSTDWGIELAAGTGTVASVVEHHHPPLPGFELPHTVALVELDEGPRLVSHLAPGESGPLAIGDRVHLVCEAVPGAARDGEPDLVLPLIRTGGDG